MQHTQHTVCGANLLGIAANYELYSSWEVPGIVQFCMLFLLVQEIGMYSLWIMVLQKCDSNWSSD